MTSVGSTSVPLFMTTRFLPGPRTCPRYECGAWAACLAGGVGGMASMSLPRHTLLGRLDAEVPAPKGTSGRGNRY